MCDQVEEFCTTNIYPLRLDWQVSSLLTCTEAGETLLNTTALPCKVTSEDDLGKGFGGEF